MVSKLKGKYPLVAIYLPKDVQAAAKQLAMELGFVRNKEGNLSALLVYLIIQELNKVQKSKNNE